MMNRKGKCESAGEVKYHGKLTSAACEIKYQGCVNQLAREIKYYGKFESAGKII